MQTAVTTINIVKGHVIIHITKYDFL